MALDCAGNSPGAFAGGVAFVLGTLPEIVRLAPLARRFGDRARVVDTGQHDDPRMSEVFFADCGMRPADAALDVGGRSRAGQIAGALQDLDRLFAAGDPAAVVVLGGSNSALAGALAANARGIPLVHVEAGLRSGDRRMPEEHNRVLIDHIADLLCAPTQDNVGNLLNEDFDPGRIGLTGSTAVEAVSAALPSPEARAKVLAEAGVQPGRYVLATIGHPENVDDPATLGAILDELAALAVDGRSVVFPVHPRTRTALAALPAGALPAGIIECEPLGRRDFLALAAQCELLVSDAAGVQEEATVLGRPLLVVRRSTERPEALEDFAALVEPGPEIGRAAQALLADIGAVHARLATLPSPFGDKDAALRIEALMRNQIPALAS